MTSRTIHPSGPIHATITPPGSKSLTNRALPLAAVAHGESVLTGVLDSEDTQIMMDSLRRMGVSLEHDPQTATIRVHGTGGNLNSADLYCGNSGTTLRFLTAMCAAAGNTGEPRTFRLDGTERMRQRPLGDLIHGLQQLEVEIHSENAEQPDCPPVVLNTTGLRGGTAEFPGNVSSQFLSGLLMAAPLSQMPIELRITGDLVSRPYIDMTLAVMKAFGVQVQELPGNRFQIPAPQRYEGRHYVVEPDASAASYFFAAAAVAGGEITVRNLTKDALQGDVGFCDCLAQMGCQVEYQPDAIVVRREPSATLRGVEVDMHAISDTAQTLSVVALFADSPTTIRNVANMRVKETDRIHAVVTELRKFGVQVEEFPDGLTIQPLCMASNPLPEQIEVATWNDHRMAMSFAIAGLKVPGVVIQNPECTAKTYPNFFEDLEKVTH